MALKEFREFFLRNVKETGGSKPDQEVGFPTEYTVKGESKFNRFLKGNFPNQAVFEKFLESITFKLNPEDKATETEQGLVKTATEAKAYDRDDSDVDSLTPVVKPSQLSNVTDDSAGDDTIAVTKSLVGGAAQFAVAISTAIKDAIALNTTTHGNKPYIYFAGADDKDGNGFTLDMAQIYDSTGSLLQKPFVALLTSASFLATPVQADFNDLWFPISGGDFAMTFAAGPPAVPGVTEGDVYVDTNNGNFYQAGASPFTFVLVFSAINGTNGVDAFTYIGYTDDPQLGAGGDFGTSASPTRLYISFQTSNVALTPVFGDFQSGWREYVGPAGANGTIVLTHTNSQPLTNGAGQILTTYANILGDMAIQPDPNNAQNFNIRVYRSDGGPQLFNYDAMNELVPNVENIRFDHANGHILGDIALVGIFDYVIKVVYFE